MQKSSGGDDEIESELNHASSFIHVTADPDGAEYAQYAFSGAENGSESESFSDEQPSPGEPSDVSTASQTGFVQIASDEVNQTPAGETESESDSSDDAPAIGAAPGINLGPAPNAQYAPNWHHNY